jgi:hypothetical protein
MVLGARTLGLVLGIIALGFPLVVIRRRRRRGEAFTLHDYGFLIGFPIIGVMFLLGAIFVK